MLRDEMERDVSRGGRPPLWSRNVRLPLLKTGLSPHRGSDKRPACSGSRRPAPTLVLASLTTCGAVQREHNVPASLGYCLRKKTKKLQNDVLLEQMRCERWMVRFILKQLTKQVISHEVHSTRFQVAHWDAQNGFELWDQTGFTPAADCCLILRATSPFVTSDTDVLRISYQCYPLQLPMPCFPPEFQESFFFSTQKLLK